jgi:high-affinity iron transporter
MTVRQGAVILGVVLASSAVLLVAVRDRSGPPPPSELHAHPSGPWTELYARIVQVREEYGEASEDNDPAVRREVLSLVDVASALAEQLTPPQGVLIEGLVRIRAHIANDDAPVHVDEAADALLSMLVETGNVHSAPRGEVQLARGAEVYQQSCAACHGANGDGRTPAAATMEPPPTRFQSGDAMNAMSPLRAYLATSYGVLETAMPAFSTLSEEDRWHVAFYLFTLRQGPCEPAARAGVKPLPVDALARASDNELVARAGEKALPCLRWLEATTVLK